VTSELSGLKKIRGRFRALAKFSLLMLRFVLHPTDFVALYTREARIANSALDVGLATLEQEIRETTQALNARIDQLRRESGSSTRGSSE